MWWLMLLMSAYGMQRQEVPCEFKASLSGLVSSGKLGYTETLSTKKSFVVVEINLWIFEVLIGGPKHILFKQLRSFNALKLFLHELESLVDAISVTKPHSCLCLILS